MGTYVNKTGDSLIGKLVPNFITIFGKEVDQGKGLVKLESLIRLDEKKIINIDPIEEGGEPTTEEVDIYKEDPDSPLMVKIEDILTDTFLDGTITGVQLMAAIAEATDNIYSGKYPKA